MPTEIVSSKVGRFVPDIDESDGSALGLAARYEMPGEGDVKIALSSVGEKRSKAEWTAVVGRFDHDFDRLIARVAAIRSEIAPKVLKLQRKSFPNKKWTGTAEDLMRHMKMNFINYYGDGTFAIWFEGDDVFDALDLNIELNRNWVVDIVKFEG